MRISLAACSLAAAHLLAVIQTASPAQAKLFRWKCDYPLVANPNGVYRDQEYSTEFEIDDATGRALVIRGGPPAEVEFTVHAGSLTLVEKIPDGTVKTTTIDEAGSAVDSRHILLRGRLVPSQSYGHCAVKPDTPK